MTSPLDLSVRTDVGLMDRPTERTADGTVPSDAFAAVLAALGAGAPPALPTPVVLPTSGEAAAVPAQAGPLLSLVGAPAAVAVGPVPPALRPPALEPVVDPAVAVAEAPAGTAPLAVPAPVVTPLVTGTADAPAAVGTVGAVGAVAVNAVAAAAAPAAPVVLGAPAAEPSTGQSPGIAGPTTPAQAVPAQTAAVPAAASAAAAAETAPGAAAPAGVPPTTPEASAPAAAQLASEGAPAPHESPEARVSEQAVPVPSALPTTVAASAAAPAAAPAAPAQVTPPADEATVAQVRPALTELARGLRSEGGQASLLIRLDPPDLGPVLVRLTVTDNRVDVQLRAPEVAATAGLVGASSDVQKVLADHGLDLSSFDVRQGELTGGGTGSSRSQEQDGRQAPGRGTSGQPSGADAGTGTNGSRVTDDATGAGDPASDTWL